MAKNTRNPRAGCFVVSGGAFHITELGLAHVRDLTALGAKVPQIAQYLRVSEPWLYYALDPEHEQFKQDVADAFDEGASEFQRRLLMAQQNLSETNAQMAIHLGKHHLGQKEDAQEVNHTIRIVGTLPDYGSSHEDWSRQFAPSPVRAIDKANRATIEAVDAEVVEVRNEK